MEAKLKWQHDLAFEANIRDHTFVLDSKSGAGGKNLGPTPKETVLSSVMGCTAMDVVGLLRKFRVEFTSFSMTAQATPREEHPRIFKDFHLNYYFEGENLSHEKIIEAVHLSMTQYCGVSAMIAALVPMTYTLYVNAKPIQQDQKVSFQ